MIGSVDDATAARSLDGNGLQTHSPHAMVAGVAVVAVILKAMSTSLSAPVRDWPRGTCGSTECGYRGPTFCAAGFLVKCGVCVCVKKVCEECEGNLRPTQFTQL